MGRVSAPRLREGRTVIQERLVPQAPPPCRWHTSRVSKSLPESAPLPLAHLEGLQVTSRALIPEGACGAPSRKSAPPPSAA